MKTFPFHSPTYQALRKKYPETPRSELLDLATGAHIAHDHGLCLELDFCPVCEGLKKSFPATVRIRRVERTNLADHLRGRRVSVLDHHGDDFLLALPGGGCAWVPVANVNT